MDTETLTTKDRETCEHYLTLQGRYARLIDAEDRAFRNYMDGRSSAGAARKARSRVNALSGDMAAAEDAVYRIMDRLDDVSGDVLGFAEAAQKSGVSTGRTTEDRVRRMTDPLARAREVHEAAKPGPCAEDEFVHNTYGALLDVAEELRRIHPLPPFGPARGCPICAALATLEARIKEETDE